MNWIKINKIPLIGILCLAFVGIVLAAEVDFTHFRRINPNQPFPQAGYVELRESGALTNSYVDTHYTRVDWYTQIALAFDITQGSITSFEYKVWWSKDGTNWYQECTETVAAGIITQTPAYYTVAISGDTAWYAPVPFAANYIKLQVKATGTVTGSDCKVAIFGHYPG